MIRACRAMTITKLDLSGLKCPLPALKTRKALKSLTPGDRLEVRCTDPLAMIDIPHLVGVTGDRLEIIERGERDMVFRIEKSASTLASKPPPSDHGCSTPEASAERREAISTNYICDNRE
jgi:tRNA 2-thiouridine synthesizing protein A